MKKTIAENAAISENSIGIKAKTEEGLGFTGNGEGMAAYVVALVFKM